MKLKRSVSFGLEKIYLLCWVLFLVHALSARASETNIDQLTEIKSGPQVAIRVTSEVVRHLPAGFFGFMLEAKIFETDSYSAMQDGIKPDVVKYYGMLPNSTYRFPGGLMANHFNWEWTIGNRASRQPQKLAEWAASSPVLFGVEEYFAFLTAVKGMPWYTLNLNGWSATEMNSEQPSQVVAESNKRLAMYVRDHTPTDTVRYYHLGNELDRSEYEWQSEKYISRSLDTMRAVKSVDSNARFVAFLRDFDYPYRSKWGKSRYKDFMRDVFTAMPTIEDISFHYYYDAPKMRKPRSDLTYRLRMFREAIDTATQLRGGRQPNVWVTEHGRSRHPDIKGSKANTFTSGLGSALAAADFWIATAQMPAIKGAFLCSIGQWNILQNMGDSAYPLPMYWTVRVLRTLDLPVVLATETTSPNHSDYAGGYDVRALAFTNESHSRYGLWAVNRASRDASATIRIPELSGKRTEITHEFLAGRPGVDADADLEPPRVVMNQSARVSHVGNDGLLILNLPANSVSSFKINLSQ